MTAYSEGVQRRPRECLRVFRCQEICINVPVGFKVLSQLKRNGNRAHRARGALITRTGVLNIDSKDLLRENVIPCYSFIIMDHLTTLLMLARRQRE